MDWIFIGVLFGSIVTSTHSTREACEGRAVILKEKGVVGKCQGSPVQISSLVSSTAGIITATPCYK